MLVLVLVLVLVLGSGSIGTVQCSGECHDHTDDDIRLDGLISVS
jgi:hypothetical protein